MTRGDQAMFSCTVNFQLPKEEITYSWRFAGGGVSQGVASTLGLGGGLCFTENGASGRSGGIWGNGLDSAFVHGKGPRIWRRGVKVQCRTGA